MTLYMPPLARKKSVAGRYNPDTFRVISNDAEELHPKYQPSEPVRVKTPRDTGGISLPDIYNRQTEVLPKSVPDYRVNRPHPASCGFLRHNVKLLNEPVCSVFTSSTHSEQNLWWPSRTSNEPLDKPPKTLDTIYRGDFLEDKETKLQRSTRHSANPNTEAALGTVPVNFLAARDGSKRFYNEKVSYEHQYNSRSDPNYPIRAKRHGSFVWEQMPKEAVDRFIESNTKQDTLEKQISTLQNNNKHQVEATTVAPGDFKANERELSPLSVLTKPAEGTDKQDTMNKQSATEKPPATTVSTDSGTSCENKVQEKTVTFQEPIKPKPKDD